MTSKGTKYICEGGRGSGLFITGEGTKYRERRAED
jgi:hypothetical protein